MGIGQEKEKTLNTFSPLNQAYPPALSDGGKLHLGNKIDLLECLIDRYEYQSDAPVISTIIIDGAVIAQMQKPTVAKNFERMNRVLRFHSICFNNHTVSNALYRDLV